MFPNNLTTNCLPKPDSLQSVCHIILNSYTDGILPVHPLFMQIRFFIVDNKNEVIKSHMASTQFNSSKFYAITEQPNTGNFIHQNTQSTIGKYIHNGSSSTFTRPEQHNHSSFMRSFNNHSPIIRPHNYTNYRRSKEYVSRSCQQTGNMPGKYSIVLNPSVFQCILKGAIPIETKEKIRAQLKMTTQDIITPQVEPTPLVSSFTYPHI